MVKLNFITFSSTSKINLNCRNLYVIMIFCSRVISVWNRLPNYVVEADSVKIFVS